MARVGKQNNYCTIFVSESIGPHLEVANTITIQMPLIVTEAPIVMIPSYCLCKECPTVFELGPSPMSKNSITVLVPHSQCSLRENPNFLQNFRPKNNTLKGNVSLLFSFTIYHSVLSLTFKGKNYYFM
jgi:hypothetical protein